MKIFIQGILAKRKIIIIFLLAILLPSLVVGYLSLSAFAKRRETVQKILESNLWISSEAALKSLEAKLLEYEEQALKTENLISLIQQEDTNQGPSNFPIESFEVMGQPFLLDADYQIIFPPTGAEDVSVFRQEKSLKILLDLYKKIRNGTWLLSYPSYQFFSSEIESILNNNLKKKFPEINKSYKALKDSEALYLQALLFTDFLKREVVPRIKEKHTLSKKREESQPERFSALRQGAKFCLISYRFLPDFQLGKSLYGGYCWGLDNFKKKILPKILSEVREDSKLQIQVIDEGGQNVLSGKKESVSKDSLSLSFRQFPLPWKLLTSQPAFNELERTARRENILYGMLLSVIVALMLLGVVLIIRDIARESETTRLRTEFVHNVSHELKTPLTLVRLYSETLQRKEDLEEKEKREAYEIITKESERLSHLINNVLDFSRIEMGRKEFNFKKGNLSDIVRDTLDSYSYHLEKKGFKIQAEIASDLPQTADTFPM